MKYRKKPVVVEAVQYTDMYGQNIPAVCNHCDDCEEPHIHTLEGIMTVRAGDWIITGVEGEHYSCKPNIFAATYEAAEENT